MEDRFSDKSVLITGASSGIGEATAIRLSNEGARCILLGRKENALVNTLNQMNNKEQHLIIRYDLTDLDNYSDLYSFIKENNIVLNGLVHCAGISKILPLRTMNKNNAMELFDIHYFSFIELVKMYAKKGISDGGSIVAVSAINAHVPQKCMTAYAAAKAAVESACRTLALELNEKSIRINSVVVGGIHSPMGNSIDSMKGKISDNYENPVNRQLLGIGTTDQIASAILFLLSEDSSFITGRELFVDGGLIS